MKKGEPLRLQYHATTFAMLRETPVLSRATVRRIDSWERRQKWQLPPSLREWYTLEGAEERLGTEDFEAYVWPLGDSLRVLTNDLRDKKVPRFTLLTLGHDDACEHEVLLDGSEDPPAVLTDGAGESHPLGPFSAFVFHWTWQNATHEHGEQPPCSLHTCDMLGPMELDFLIEHFDEGPRQVIDTSWDYMEEHPYKHYFFGPAGRVGVFCKTDPTRGETEASWTIQAENDRDLESLTRRVWACGTLSKTLSSSTRIGRNLLRRLRRPRRR